MAVPVPEASRPLASSPGPSRRARLPLAAALAAAALAAAGCARTSASPAPSPAEQAVPVRTAPVERGEVSRPVRAAGTIAPKDTWSLAFKSGGLVARVHVREGDAVRKGQVLATLDTTQLAAGARQAREGLAKAERDLERARALRAEDVIPRAAAEDAETGAAVAAAALEAVEFDLRNAVLVAPDHGWVDRRLAEPGEVVAPGRPVLELSGEGRGFVVRANLAERDVLGVEAGAAAAVLLDARPGERLAGRVVEVARSAARGTGTYEVEIALDGAPRLLAGLTAKVEIARSVAAAAAVPLGAIVEGDGADGAVFAVRDGVAARVPVRIAFLAGGSAVLAEDPGLAEVVSEGAPRLAEGVPVSVVR